MINRFNIRVYFIIVDSTEKSVLVSDEIIQGKFYTKFPGGGLEYGESIVDCIHREAMEELGQDVQVIRHLYTTDFFVQSAFRPNDQVISIYYLVSLPDSPKFRTTHHKFDFTQQTKDEESFRWIKKEALSESEFDFPADKRAASELLKQIDF